MAFFVNFGVDFVKPKFWDKSPKRCTPIIIKSQKSINFDEKSYMFFSAKYHKKHEISRK